MKYLLYQSSPLLFSYMSVLIDEAIELVEDGNEVIFVSCNGCMSHCFDNMEGKKSRCLMCQCAWKHAKKLLPSSVKIVNLKKYWNESRFSGTFEYCNEKQIKQIKYKGVNIGFSVLSSYISITRNAYPLIDENSKLYFDALISQTCKLTDALDSIYSEYNPDKVLLFNGRLFEVKPAMDLAIAKSIDYSVFEVTGGYNSPFYKTEFHNTTPHGIAGNWDACLRVWDRKDIPNFKKEEIAKSFFEKRRNGVPAGDKVYVKNQKKGELPKNWDVCKKNIVIFNSSEDEFSSIGDEFEKYAVFNSQIEGIKYILSEMSSEPEYHFYLRIHPNLSNIPYKYHTDLLNLPQMFKNVTVIPGPDSVSSYSLMEAAEKVVVFGSSMGVESAYWDKPVILLSGSFYYHAGLCYTVTNKSELKKLLMQPLQSRKNINALKYAYYILYNNTELKNNHLDINWDIFSFCGKKIMNLHYLKIFGSSKLYALLLALIHSVCKRFDNPKFILPIEEA